jgi:translation initiation factor 1
MSNAKRNNSGGFMYSTNPNYRPEQDEDENVTLNPKDQLLTLHRETKGRGGKAVVVIKGFVGDNDALSELGKKLKAHCGTGGSVKDGEIIIQGDQRPKVESFLKNASYRIKLVGG